MYSHSSRAGSNQTGSNPAEIIESQLSALAVAQRYGFKPNNSGFINCPFHGEKTASLKLYPEPNRGWYCFGCNEGGGVVKFVQKHFNLAFPQAILRLSTDFNIPIPGRRLSPLEIREQNRIRKEENRKRERFVEKQRQEYNQWCAYHRYLHWAIKHFAPTEPSESLKPEYVFAINNINRAEHWLESHKYWRLGR